MSGAGRKVWAAISDKASSDRIVPPTGHTAFVTLYASAAMAFLAVFALALSLASNRLADRWSAELSQAATLQIPAGDNQIEATERAMLVLSETPGVASAQALSAEEQAALLEPWFGGNLPEQNLPIPQLIEVVADDPPYDITVLRDRLSDEVPGAILEDHARWRRPLVDAALSIRRLGWLAVFLIGGAMAAMITLAAQASLAASRQVIDVLRLVGARDGFIATAFVRRFALRAMLGAALGSAAGVLALLVLPPAADTGGFLTGLGFQGAGWIWPIVIPVLAGAIALIATWLAAMRRLRRLT